MGIAFENEYKAEELRELRQLILSAIPLIIQWLETYDVSYHVIAAGDYLSITTRWKDILEIYNIKSIIIDPTFIEIQTTESVIFIRDDGTVKSQIDWRPHP